MNTQAWRKVLGFLLAVCAVAMLAVFSTSIGEANPITEEMNDEIEHDNQKTYPEPSEVKVGPNSWTLEVKPGPVIHNKTSTLSGLPQEDHNDYNGGGR